MVDTPTNNSQPQSPHQSGPKPSGGRQRIISSCLTCRRRKVRCDHVHPVCGACTRGSHVCTYATDQSPGPGVASSAGRISKPSSGSGKLSKSSDVQARLDRLEMLLEKAVSGQQVKSSLSGANGGDSVRHDLESKHSPSSNSQTSQSAGMSSDNHDGTLLLDGEQSQFVSSLHYALLADEIQDIKALLGEHTDEGHDGPTQNNLIHLLSLGRAKVGVTLENLLPESQEHRDALLEVYFANVDPMVRITHKPSLMRRLPTYVRELHPMVFAVFYSAVNSLPPTVVENRFGDSKEEIMARLELGIEIGLARGNYLTTQNMEIFQAFILWLTCITREEDMGKAWTLLGVALRIALGQGLHRDPSLFPSGSWDVVTIETRRRVWHQVCHLEFRAAECKGQEPSIDEDDYTTMMPRNIDDEELIEGASPGPTPYDEDKFTSNTFQLVRFVGMRSLRRIVKSTYRLERRMMESGLRGTSGPDPAQELRAMFEEIKTMVDAMHEENYRKYLRFCNPDIAVQKLTLGLASLLEWRSYLLFWLRMPRAYRDVVFSSDIRRSIFDKSLNCIEALNSATVDVDAARFRWHIGGHAAFQAIMHVLSELRNPLFEVPDRQRALRALQLSRLLKENNHTKPWEAIKNMIDKVAGETIVSRDNASSTPFGGAPESARMPTATPSTVNLPAYPEQMQGYSPQPMMSQPLSMPSMQPMAPMQQQQQQGPAQFNWDELNFSNIFGEAQPTAELPEFDFGFWGDPVNFGNEPLTFPLDGGYSMPWAS
ncbi:hypothetical protein K458DRAFT_315506 [Lentithecium fluviatile CBS 122367]|uniref:Zn(2)-C6 fungal-type domain-containing protein n=1 Tax=Lentithecium fluviatile CBS 122367 TaxID=1168545 RepID=A0A6G1ILP7_9PLEO|nr:hypothetical protein K458DRAFT_315506 [Lentithecium fluviatile CBS 122367]